MTKDEAMKLALEALESNSYGNTWIGEISRNAIAALRQALEQPDDAAWARHLKEPMSEKRVHKSDTIVPSDYSGKAGDYTEQEPVAWELRKGKTDRVLIEITNNPKRAYDWKCSLEEAVPLYTAPPSKPWVSLTDEEIDLLITLHAPPIHPDFNDDDDFIELVEAIEAKLKEKNHA